MEAFEIIENVVAKKSKINLAEEKVWNINGKRPRCVQNQFIREELYLPKITLPEFEDKKKKVVLGHKDSFFLNKEVNVSLWWADMIRIGYSGNVDDDEYLIEPIVNVEEVEENQDLLSDFETHETAEILDSGIPDDFSQSQLRTDLTEMEVNLESSIQTDMMNQSNETLESELQMESNSNQLEHLEEDLPPDENTNQSESNLEENMETTDANTYHFEEIEEHLPQEKSPKNMVSSELTPPVEHSSEDETFRQGSSETNRQTDSITNDTEADRNPQVSTEENRQQESIPNEGGKNPEIQTKSSNLPDERSTKDARRIAEKKIRKNMLKKPNQVKRKLVAKMKKPPKIPTIPNVIYTYDHDSVTELNNNIYVTQTTESDSIDVTTESDSINITTN